MTEDKIKEAAAKFAFLQGLPGSMEYEEGEHGFTAGAQWALQQPKEPELNQQELCFDIAVKLESNIDFVYINKDGSYRCINAYEFEAALRMVLESENLVLIRNNPSQA